MHSNIKHSPRSRTLILTYPTERALRTEGATVFFLQNARFCQYGKVDDKKAFLGKTSGRESLSENRTCDVRVSSTLAVVKRKRALNNDRIPAVRTQRPLCGVISTRLGCDTYADQTALLFPFRVVYVFFVLNRSFYPSTSSTTSVRADSSTLERCKVCGQETMPH